MLANILPAARGLAVVAGLIALSVTPVLGERATQLEMDQVCRNWMTEITFATGDWGGATNPTIREVSELRAGDTLLARCYNIEPEGFVVVSALKEMTPVKAYSETGVLDEQQEGGFLALLRETMSDRMGRYARAFGSLDAPQPPDGEALFGRSQRARWDRYAVSEVDFSEQMALSRVQPLEEAGPLLTTSWHQRAPYYNLCPMGDGGRTVVGCVATATAQILAYWQWPPSGYGSYSYTWAGDNSCGGSTPAQELPADFSDPYDWANMIDSCDDGCSMDEGAALSELCYEVGVAFGMDYGACGSGASTGNAVVVFPTYYKYSTDIRRENRTSYSLAEWYNIIKTEVDAGRPGQYRINLHSIVADGYRDLGGQYQYHMNYGWGNSFNTWYVLDSLYCSWYGDDSICPANEEFIITHIYPQDQPVLGLIGQTVSDPDGDNDGHADVAEDVLLDVTIRNLGWDASNATGILHTDDPNITITQSAVSFGTTIEWGAQAASVDPFAFTVGAGCPDPHIVTFELTVTADGGYSTVDSFYVFVGDSKGLTDDMESGPGFWTHAPVIPTYADEWHLETYRAHSGATSWKAGGLGSADYASTSDGGLVTPPFLLPQNAQLSFWHRIDTEPGDPGQVWDGGIVMISTDGSEWTQITPEGGYPYTIVPNGASPFDPDTPCYGGSHDWSEAVFDLSAYSGVARIMWRLGTDGAVTDEGWYVDDVSIVANGCCIGDVGNVMLVPDCDGDQSVDVGDLTNLIDHLFISFTDICCIEEADLNGPADASVDVGDLTILINHLFIGFDPLPACP